MDNTPKTRKESKKDPKEKRWGKEFGSQKHVRQVEKLLENKTPKGGNDSSNSKTPHK